MIRDKQITILWEIGMAILVLCTIVLSFSSIGFEMVLQQKEDELKNIESQMRINWDSNYNLYVHFSILSDIWESTLATLYVNYPSNKFPIDLEPLARKSDNYKRIALQHLNITSKNKPATDVQIQTWNMMTRDELLNEEKKLMTNNEGDILSKKIREKRNSISFLNKMKNYIILLIVTVQTLGLALINAANFFKK
ncbi:MAG: hypothetical protein WC645_01670 [Candidatus Margulisiibacteriota bacterium]